MKHFLNGSTKYFWSLIGSVIVVIVLVTIGVVLRAYHANEAELAPLTEVTVGAVGVATASGAMLVAALHTETQQTVQASVEKVQATVIEAIEKQK